MIETPSVRLSEEERNFLEPYLEKHYNNKFSAFVHDCIKREKELIQNNKRNNFFEDFKQEVIFLGLGAIFFFFSFDQTNLLGTLLLFLLGVFFVTSTLISILYRLKRRNDHAGQR